MQVDAGEPSQAPASVLFDSLPYYDNDFERDPSLKDKAARLIARELAPPAGLHPRVPPSLTLFAVRAPPLRIFMPCSSLTTFVSASLE